jgi:catechol 2,3-dioxygenase-like lactoylglutathione lyase family enzyme
MKVDRILETALYAEDLAAAEAFYTRIMGLEVYGRVEGRHVFFRCGAGMLLVFNPNTTEKEQAGAHGTRGFGHIAWAVAESELPAWRAWLESHGIHLKDHLWPDGLHSLYFHDPAGNSLELTTPRLWGISA